MKNFTAFVLILAYILIFSFASYAAAKVFGMGNIGDTYIEFALSNDGSTGVLTLNDNQNQATFFGEITSVTSLTSSEVAFSGKCTDMNGAELTFDADARNIETENNQTFSIKVSDGYVKSGVIDTGLIKIISK